jgi:hypothetical protein
MLAILEWLVGRKAHIGLTEMYQEQQNYSIAAIFVILFLLQRPVQLTKPIRKPV